MNYDTFLLLLLGLWILILGVVTFFTGFVGAIFFIAFTILFIALL